MGHRYIYIADAPGHELVLADYTTQPSSPHVPLPTRERGVCDGGRRRMPALFPFCGLFRFRASSTLPTDAGSLTVASQGPVVPGCRCLLFGVSGQVWGGDCAKATWGDDHVPRKPTKTHVRPSSCARIHQMSLCVFFFCGCRDVGA